MCMCAIRSVGGDPAIELYYNFKFFHFICGIYLCWVEGDSVRTKDGSHLDAEKQC